MKMIDGAASAACSNNLAQALLALAIGRAHDFGAGDVEEARLALVGDGARQPRLAGSGRSVEQHALGRIDAQPLENLGMAQRQLDHLAQRVDGVLHSAEIVIGDVGAALAVLLGIFGKQLDLGLGVDVDDALGHRADDRQPHLLEREGRRAQHLAHFLGHVGVDPLVALGGDDVAFDQRPSGEAAPQRFRRSLEPQIVLRRGEHDPRRRLGLGLADLDDNRPSRRRHWRAAGRRGG